MAIEVRLLTREDLGLINALDMGYSSAEMYGVSCVTDGADITYNLTPVPLERPFTIAYEWDWTEAPGFLEHLDDGLVWGAFFGDESADVAGCAGLIELRYADEGSAIFIESLFVDRPWRGHGVGGMLLETAVRWATTQNARALLVTTQTGNMPAIKFYRKAGFSICGLHDRFYSNSGAEKGEAAIFLVKEL